MSVKLFKAKKWLTLKDAAKRISIELEGEPCSIGDVLQLAADQVLRISVYFPHDWLGKVFDITTDLEEVKKSIKETIGIDGNPFKYCEYEKINDTEFIKPTNRQYEYSSGIYEVKMTGSSRIDVNQYMKLAKGVEYAEVFCLSGFFVFSKNGDIVERQNVEYGGYYCDIETKEHRKADDFIYPCVSIDEIEGAFFVIQTEHLNEFIASLEDEQNTEQANSQENSSKDYIGDIPLNTNGEKLSYFINLLIEASPELQKDGRKPTYSELHTILQTRLRNKKIPSKATIQKYMNQI